MSAPFDVAVIGMGAMGGAAAYHLARRGQRVVAVDRYAPPHAMGSSHGRTRMIREAYHEHPLYVPLVQRAYALWDELEREGDGRRVLLRTGGLMIGPEHGSMVAGCIRSATEHGLPYEVVPAAHVRRRYPAFAPLDGMVGVLDPRAGILFPESIIALHLQLAARHGAELRPNRVLQGWDRTPDGIALSLDGEAVTARQVVVAAGAWTGPLLPGVPLPLTVERQVTYWFDPVRAPEQFTAERMPVSIWQLESGDYFFTKPDLGDGVKAGWHHGGATVTAESIDRQVSASEDASIDDLLRRFVPFAKGHVRDRAVCMYANTPDQHFVVDRHPELPEMLILSACSGHGFKFASVLGEAVADLVTTGASRFDLSPFALARFTSEHAART